jgi:DNA repair protein RecO (recombination protein O)
MPDLAHCQICGRPFSGAPAYFNSQTDGLACAEHRHPASRALAAASLTAADRIFRNPVAAFAAEDWPRGRAADLRRFALQSLERHLERKLRSAVALGRLGADAG